MGKLRPREVKEFSSIKIVKDRAWTQPRFVWCQNSHSESLQCAKSMYFSSYFKKHALNSDHGPVLLLLFCVPFNTQSWEYFSVRFPSLLVATALAHDLWQSEIPTLFIAPHPHLLIRRWFETVESCRLLPHGGSACEVGCIPFAGALNLVAAPTGRWQCFQGTISAVCFGGWLLAPWPSHLVCQPVHRFYELPGVFRINGCSACFSQKWSVLHATKYAEWCKNLSQVLRKLSEIWDGFFWTIYNWKEQKSS